MHQHRADDDALPLAGIQLLLSLPKISNVVCASWTSVARSSLHRHVTNILKLMCTASVRKPMTATISEFLKTASPLMISASWADLPSLRRPFTFPSLTRYLKNSCISFALTWPISRNCSSALLRKKLKKNFSGLL